MYWPKDEFISNTQAKCVHHKQTNDGATEREQKKMESRRKRVDINLELHLSMVKNICRFRAIWHLVKMRKKVQREIFIKLSLKFVHFSFDIRGSRDCKCETETETGKIESEQEREIAQSELCIHLRWFAKAPSAVKQDRAHKKTAHIPVNTLLDASKEMSKPKCKQTYKTNSVWIKTVLHRNHLND